MPKAVEKALRREGEKKGLFGERLRAFIYGTLRNKYNWKPKRSPFRK